MGVFTGCCIALELGTTLAFKKKQEIRKLITDNDGIISFIITKKCNFLVTTEGPERAKDSFKCRTAVKLNIPVVSVDFLYDSVANSGLADPEAFYVVGETKKQLLTRGVIPLAKPSTTAVKAKKPFLLNWNTVKSWTDASNDAPDFHHSEAFELARSAVLQKSQKSEFCVIELHVAMGNKTTTTTDYESGIVLHIIDTSHPTKARKEYRCGKTLEEGIAIYCRLHQIYTEPPHSYVRAQKPYPPNIGSAKFQKAQLSVTMETVATIDPAVLSLVDEIWTEATGRLDDVLSIAVSNIKVEQVEKAESVLLEIKRLLDSDNSGGNHDNEAKQRIAELSDEFYSHLPHNNEHRTTIDNKKSIANKQRMCQLVLDVVSVSESTGWSQRCSALAKYRALRCHVAHIALDSTEYDDVVGRTRSERMDRIVNIFRVSRPIEDIEFRADVDNRQIMCHASQVENFVGILSRGLLLPKVVVDDLGGKRTDPGMLGHGIYFADSPSTSVGYSHPSRCKGTRLMALCEVALGRCYETTHHDTSLTAPPADYDSVHGVGASGGITSEFKDDEFVVYSTDRQRLRYLVEFTVPGDSPVDRPLDLTAQSADLEQSPEESVKEQVSLSDVKDVKNPLDEVKAGLVSNTDAAVPLRSVHVRAKLVDLAAQVVVLQEYHNDSSLPIEAKFVFPLDEMSVVCGFEAFINGKHVVGVVKEKETAHREYKQAVEAGHGAYLMDQDKEQPDVFTVSVGNLPAYCTAIIKITYVAELLMDGEFISFRVPGSVAPWTEQSAMHAQTQTMTKTVGAAGSVSRMTIQVSVEMPFDIRTIHSPTHRLRIKKTATRAVVEMANDQSITDGGFQLLILLAELHVPRMWVEQLPDNTDSRACMLAFYPEFETSPSTAAESTPEFEVIFFLDLSNSMKDSTVSDAKKVLLLALDHLPPTCTFNIVRFGTDYDELFPCSRQKTDDNVTLATDYVNSSSATLGNTDVYRPLHTYHLLSRLFYSADECRLPVNVFLVSDGHLSNAEQTFHAARSNAQHTRIFTLGVGDAANRHTLRSLAHVGGGSFEFFDRKFKSKWEGRVKGQLTKAAQSSLSSIEVEWQTFSDDNSSSAKLVQAPASIMALFSGCRQVIYGFVPNCSQATLKAVINNQQVSTVVSTSELGVTTGNMLHQLTARAVIHDWQQGLLSDDCLQQQITKKNTKNYIIKLSIDYSIVTEFTSFVAIETRDKDEVIDVTSRDEVVKLIQQNSVDALDYMGWQVEEKSELELTGEKLQNGDYAELTKEQVEDYMGSLGEPSSKCNPQYLQVLVDVFRWGKATQQPELTEKDFLQDIKEQYDEIVSELDTLSEESYAASTAIISQLKDFMDELQITESTSSSSSSSDFCARDYDEMCCQISDEFYGEPTPRNLAKSVTLHESSDERELPIERYESMVQNLVLLYEQGCQLDRIESFEPCSALAIKPSEARPTARLASSSHDQSVMYFSKPKRRLRSGQLQMDLSGRGGSLEHAELLSVTPQAESQKPRPSQNVRTYDSKMDDVEFLCASFEEYDLGGSSFEGDNFDLYADSYNFVSTAALAETAEEAELSALFSSLSSSRTQPQEDYHSRKLPTSFYHQVEDLSKQAVSGASAKKAEEQLDEQHLQQLSSADMMQQPAASDKLSEKLLMEKDEVTKVKALKKKAPNIRSKLSLACSDDSIEADAVTTYAVAAVALKTGVTSNVASLPRDSIMQSSDSFFAPLIDSCFMPSSSAEVVEADAPEKLETYGPKLGAASTVSWRCEIGELDQLAPRRRGARSVQSKMALSGSSAVHARKFTAPPPSAARLWSSDMSRDGGAAASVTGFTPPQPPPPPPSRQPKPVRAAGSVLSRASSSSGVLRAAEFIAPPPSETSQLSFDVSADGGAASPVTRFAPRPPPPPPPANLSVKMAAPSHVLSLDLPLAYEAASNSGFASQPPPPPPAFASIELAAPVKGPGAGFVPPSFGRCGFGGGSSASHSFIGDAVCRPESRPTSSFAFGSATRGSSLFGTELGTAGASFGFAPHTDKMAEPLFGGMPGAGLARSDFAADGILEPAQHSFICHAAGFARSSPASTFAFGSSAPGSGTSLFAMEPERVAAPASFGFASPAGKIAEPLFGAAPETDSAARSDFAADGKLELVPHSFISQAADVNTGSLPASSCVFRSAAAVADGSLSRKTKLTSTSIVAECGFGPQGQSDRLSELNAESQIQHQPQYHSFRRTAGLPTFFSHGSSLVPPVPPQVHSVGFAASTSEAERLLKCDKETQTTLTLLPPAAGSKKKMHLGGRKTSDEMLRNLFSVVHYDHTHGDIYWDLTVCHLILVDEVACTSTLRRAGITTLGENCAKDSSCLLATLMVLFHVLEWSRSMFTNSSSLTALLRDVASGNYLSESTVPAEFHRGLMDAARYCLRMDLQRPLVYTTLELGLSWSDVVFDFLRDFKVDATTAALESSENLKNIYCAYLDFIV